MPEDIDLRQHAVARERARFARELHDVLGKTLHGIGLAAEAIPLWIRRDSAIAVRYAEALSQASTRALGELRAVVTGLRLGPGSGVSGTGSGVSGTGSGVSGTGSGAEAAGSVGAPRTPWLDVEIHEQVLAVLGEALTNVARHADASEVTVTLRRSDEALELRVRDDGCGFEPQPFARLFAGRRFGLVGMAERAELVDAELSVMSGVAEGTEVILRIPVPQSRSPQPAPTPSLIMN